MRLTGRRRPLHLVVIASVRYFQFQAGPRRRQCEQLLEFCGKLFASRSAGDRFLGQRLNLITLIAQTSIHKFLRELLERWRAAPLDK